MFNVRKIGSVKIGQIMKLNYHPISRANKGTILSTGNKPSYCYHYGMKVTRQVAVRNVCLI